jgi:uncharacterized membrane protein
MFKAKLPFDEARVIAAIRAAESRTSAELRVSVDRKAEHPPKEAAARAFHRLGMHQTEHRNGVLILIQPKAKRFAVLGDRGIHAHAGQAFWDRLAGLLSEAFAKGQFTEGLEAALAEAGRQLAEHFPAKSGNPDELPDSIDRI